MIPDGRTLILVADGCRARLFDEARRGGPLTERPEWLAGLPEPLSNASPGREGGRAKAGAGFVAQLSRRLEAIFARQHPDQLVIIAAPRALGQLRRHLSPGLKTKLALSDPHDRLSAGPGEIQQVLRARRLAAA